MPKESSLPAQTALFDDTPRDRTIGAVTLTETPNLALASLAMRRTSDTFADTARAFLGCDLPAPGQMSVSESFKVFWTGPDQWMVCAAFDRHELLSQQLSQQFGSSASVTEQTDAWCGLSLYGAGCQELFMRLCPIDILSFSDQQATRTTIEHMGCFVLHLGAKYLVLVPRSFAGSAWEVIASAAQSIR